MGAMCGTGSGSVFEPNALTSGLVVSFVILPESEASGFGSNPLAIIAQRQFPAFVARSQSQNREDEYATTNDYTTARPHRRGHFFLVCKCKRRPLLGLKARAKHRDHLCR